MSDFMRRSLAKADEIAVNKGLGGEREGRSAAADPSQKIILISKPHMHADLNK